MEISRRAYARYFGDTWRERLLRRVACRLPESVGSLAPFRAAWEHWAQIRMVLRDGALNPALVLDPAVGRVAVFTNLSNRPNAPKPVVRIIEERLHLIRPTVPAAGARVAAACIYWRKEAGPPEADWDDFSPIVLDCLVDNLPARRAAMDRIRPAAWEALNLAVPQLEAHAPPGLYPVAIPPAILSHCW